MQKQILMQQQMQERQMAMQIAKSRDFCNWLMAFYVTAGAGLINGFRKTKRPYLLAPLVPLTFGTLFYWDLSYGNKLQRIRKEADRIMTDQPDVLGRPPTPPAPVSTPSRYWFF